MQGSLVLLPKTEAILHLSCTYLTPILLLSCTYLLNRGGVGGSGAVGGETTLFTAL